MKTLHTLILLLAFSFTISLGFSQQDPQWTNYMYNQLSYNAGAVGSHYKLQSTAIYRHQWTGFGNEPRTGMIAVDSKVEAIHGGIGGMVMYDELGLEKNIVAKLGYAYHLSLGSGTMQFGVNGEYMRKTLDYSGFIAIDPNDPLIPTGQISDNAFDAGAGLFYHTEKWQAGFGATHLLESNFNDLNFEMARHYYLHGSYRFKLGEKIALEPMFLAKTDRALTQLDATFRIHFLDMLYLGASYREEDAYALMLGYKNEHFRIGYSYDRLISELSNYTRESHEFFVSFLIQ